MKNWDGSSWIYDFFLSIKHQKHISRNAWVNFSAFYNIRVFDVCSSLKQISKLLISTIQQWCEINTLSYTSTAHSYNAACWRFDVQPRRPHIRNVSRNSDVMVKRRENEESFPIAEKTEWALASLWNTNIKLMKKTLNVKNCHWGILSHSKCCSV